MRPSLILRSAGGKIPYPKHVWSPAGGWYAQPANWKANTAIMLGVVSGVVAMAWSVSADREHRYKMPEPDRFFPSRLTQGEIEVLRNSFIRSSANIWDNVTAFVRQYTRFLDVSPRSIREFFVSEVLKASAPTWKCELFANEGIKDEEFWDVHEGSFEDLRALLNLAQFRAVKQRLESEIDRCWAEVAKEIALLTGREFEIGDVKALYEQHHGGKPGAEAGIINGMARMEV
nr:hypothetical protein B0A51_07564 [Rachicladosporium sp. CCFEE 5018]